MRHDEGAERAALREDLLWTQAEMETSLVPELIESVLSIRLTMQQLKVLAILTTAQEGIAMQTLAKHIGVSLATMSGIVDRLESQGMVDRATDPSDHRVRRVVPTLAGRETVQQALAARPQLSQPLLDRLAIADLRALDQGIAALLRAVREHDPQHGADRTTGDDD